MLLCMRTTIDISDDLLRRAKRRAADESTSLKAVVEGALRAWLATRRRGKGYRLTWHPEQGMLQPGVDLEDRDALFDRMDGRP